MKKAVLLINLGSPDAPTIKSVWKYLRQFLMDGRVIDIPYLIRLILVNLIIIPKRVSNSTKEYKKMWVKYGNSPLIENTKKLTTSLNKKYSSHYDFYYAMRYQNPSIESVLTKIYKHNYKEIVLLPLYPQYASASTGSTIEYCNNIINRWWNFPKIRIINQFYSNPFYIDCFVENAKKYDINSYDKILFSYHGLPERHVDKTYNDNSLCADNQCEDGINDNNMFCYKAQCYETTKLIADKLALDKKQYITTFQSRLDNKWIKPYTDDIMNDLIESNNLRVLVLSPAFVSDCLETLIEIGETYEEEFKDMGGKEFTLVPSLNHSDNWVDSIFNIIESNE